jgi:hypothetical protein
VCFLYRDPGHGLDGVQTQLGDHGHSVRHEIASSYQGIRLTAKLKARLL